MVHPFLHNSSYFSIPTLTQCSLSSSCSHQPSAVNPCGSNVPVALRTSLRRSSLCPPSPFTPSAFTAALHSAARHPSFWRSSPFTPPPFMHPLTLHSALHCAARHPSFRRPSPRFTPALHSAAIQSRLSLRHPLPFIPPFFTLHSPTLRSSPSIRHPSLPPFNTPPFTLHPVILQCRPSLRRPSLTPTLDSTAQTTSICRAPARPTTREQLPRIFPWSSCSCHP
jgi:hypothetical protein